MICACIEIISVCIFSYWGSSATPISPKSYPNRANEVGGGASESKILAGSLLSLIPLMVCSISVTLAVWCKTQNSYLTYVLFCILKIYS